LLGSAVLAAKTAGVRRHDIIDGRTVANILLALFIVGIAAAWRRSQYWMPGPRPGMRARGRLLLVAGWLVVLLATGFSAGDVVSGRTQISKNPVHYASRLRGPHAHTHDILDTPRYWQQIALQTSVGLLVGVSLILLSSPPSRRLAAA
jgi:hypothetical protein